MDCRLVLTHSQSCPWNVWFHWNRRKGGMYSTVLSLSRTLPSPGAKSDTQYFSFTLCPLFMKQQSCWPVVALNNHSSLLRNANLPQCAACPTGLPPSVSPFHVWQSISSRHPSTAAAPWEQPQLPRVKICCCSLNMRLRHKIPAYVPNLDSRHFGMQY